MSEWPEALVEKLATAIEESDVQSPVSYRRNAIAALDALGLREEFRVRLDGDYTEYPPSREAAEVALAAWGTIPTGERRIQQRFTLSTPWEDV